MADVGENLLGLDFGEMTMEVGGNVVPLQEGCGDVWECEVSVETHKTHTAPLPKASHHCRLSR